MSYKWMALAPDGEFAFAYYKHPEWEGNKYDLKLSERIELIIDKPEWIKPGELWVRTDYPLDGPIFDGSRWDLIESNTPCVDQVQDQVSHPNHYTNGPKCPGCGRVIECIDISRHMGFADGNAQKYLWRYKLKGTPAQDIRKAIQYLEWVLEDIDKQS